jgi:hypothetical protein
MCVCVCVCVTGVGYAVDVSNFSTFSLNQKGVTQLHASLYSSGEECALRVVYPFPPRKVCLECLVNMLFSSLVVMQMWNITYFRTFKKVCKELEIFYGDIVLIQTNILNNCSALWSNRSFTYQMHINNP